MWKAAQNDDDGSSSPQYHPGDMDASFDNVIQLQAQLLERAHDAVLIRDSHDVILSWNRGAQELYGWSAEEAVGKTSHTLLQPRFSHSLEAVEALLIQEGQWEGTLTHTCRDGREVIVESRQGLIRRPSSGRLLAIVEINRDITQRERLLEEQAIAHATELVLRETVRRMDEFIGITGHELQTPMTTIKGNLQLVSRRLAQLSENATPYPELHATISSMQTALERVERQVRVQTRLVNDLLDISRLQANGLELHLASCNLTTIVREAVDDQCTIAPMRTISLQMREEELLILADADRIGQVVTNYLSNALKYSRASQPVVITVTKEGHRVRVAVTDRGQGLTPQQQKQIWERFYRAEGITVQSGTGVNLGLGLYICGQLIQRQGGEVGVESSSEHGSTFWFTLPLVERTDS
ncbi:PAS domain-containing sensor histidine kinase [Ktedonospora formicarum]|uniref:histidine kinase n=1 Tax=Ktedonospora formicarum TaxID=2778364 RepID=A0A8J3ICJ6_9CHLR|nr:ATP-binding protein [Ktedonospora formicarum]GHO48909.1 hypothetical protein KSX_70720 [Ktedonospora formicarum]